MSNTLPSVDSQTQIINIAAYKFAPLDRLVQRRADYLALCRSLGLKGTILLSSEGINLFWLVPVKELIGGWSTCGRNRNFLISK
jgi:hypothetical protein